MADLPQPQSYQQLLSDMLSSYAARAGINDFNVGSATTSFFETVALTTARASGDVFQILRDFSVDRATGDALKRLAIENNVTPLVATPATGTVNVIDSSFTKISTKVYAGANPPNIGSTQINVSDASLFPATGSIYIGRGTPNVEGPLPYTSITTIGGYFVINLTSPTIKFHNVGETVILAQGGVRSIPVNTIVVSPSVGANTDIQFAVTLAAVILDGETEVDGVQVTALNPGSASNAPIGAIKQFSTPPFSGATVTNSLPFTTGTDTETDDQLRIRIKRTIASIGLGTATAVKSAVIGAVAPDQLSIIVSDEILLTSNGATLYIDDGTGYEATTTGVGLEDIVDSALGGEQFFQLSTGGTQTSVAKAFLISTLSAPFDLIGGDTLAIVVGGITYQHVFSTSDFVSPGGATAYEITASINADTLLGFEATTSGGGQFIVIRAIAETHDDLQITTPTTSGRDASVLLGLPSGLYETLRLYKNTLPLTKDGVSASLFTQSQELWSSSIENDDTLILSVDGTAPITYTILDSDFINTGLYTSVAATNSLESWVEVFNAKLTGVTAAIVGSQIEITSNLGFNNRAALSIDPSSTLVTKGMFSATIGLSLQGQASDFILDRNTAQFELTVPLQKGDQLQAGSLETQARLQSSLISGGNITFPSDAHFWLLIDSPGQIIPTGVVGNTILNTLSPSSNVVRYQSLVASAFNNVQVGDYLIVWSLELDINSRLEGRVNAVTDTTLDILITPAEFASFVPQSGILFANGFVVLRSVLAPQKFKVATGINQTLDQIAQELQGQTYELLFTVLEEEYLVITSNTKNTTGYLLAVTADTQGILLNLPINKPNFSQESLIAFYESGTYQGQFPLFIHSSFSAGSFANPPDTFINSVTSTISLAGRDPNELLSILHPYGAIRDAQPYGEADQETSIASTVIGVENDSIWRRIRNLDRYFIASPFDFGNDDTLITVLDNDTEEKTFEIPLFRDALTNTSLAVNPSNFNAYDVDSGPTANFVSAFGPTFDFSNFKVLMRAKKVLSPQGIETALLYRATMWGRSGQNINVGYIYPSAPNSPISSTVVVGSNVAINIVLASGAVAPTSIDGTTEWNVSITANTPIAGVDQVTYSWSGTGTNPALTLSGGEYVNITPQTEFSPANDGIFRVSTQAGFAPTSTSFTVQRPTGVAVSESNKATFINTAITFYQPGDTTAADVNAYVNANLSSYFTTTIVNDGGMTGAGIIVYSTFEDSNFTFSSVQLQDGINYIASSNLSGSPQFVFKTPLALPTDVGYAFNNSESIKLIPTTINQIYNLLSILAVTGFTTVGSINPTERDTRLELETNILGSQGAIQIIGGLANEYEVPILDSGILLNNSLMEVSVDSIASRGVLSDQWFQLQASVAQQKDTLFSSNTSFNVLPDVPSFGETTIQALDRQPNQRYFGNPRNYIRTEGRTFRVEKQGSLVCISWNGIGLSPQFLKSPLNFNDSAGGTLNVSVIPNIGEAEYINLTGNTNFTELSIGDLITVAGSTNPANNGTFLVTAVSADGTIVTVLNSLAVNEYSSGTFTFTGNIISGDAFTVGASTLIAGTNFAVGGTSAISATNLASVIGTLPGVSAAAVGTVVTVTATSPSASIAISYAGSPNVTVSGSHLVGASFVAGNFSASSSVSEGDTVILSAPFNILNQGQYRVIRRYNDSIYIENANVVEEEVTLPANLISLGFDATTSFQVVASNHNIYLTWNGIGTEPFLGNAQVGDIITLGTDFAAANQGQFMVTGSGIKLPEITQVTAVPGSAFTLSGPGTYFLVNSSANVHQYYVWFNVNGTNTDPAPIGLTGVMVAILSGDNSTQVATKAASAINGATGLTATSSVNIITITTTGSAPTTASSNVNVPAPFSVVEAQQGRYTFLEAINPSAINQAAVFVTTNILENQRPQMQFFEYEATVPNDFFVVTGNTLTAQNNGKYVISRVIDQNTAIVTGALAAVSNVNLSGRETSVFVQEGVPYSGYKRVEFVVPQQGAAQRNLLVFDTNAQYEKINESSQVQMTSLNKLNFNTIVKNGLDSYAYNTGLIREANRIIYGDPRDPLTYPGVGAAGADIFIREPLALRIQLSIDIRINTGVPFAQMANQVVTNVSYLVNSNPVGQPIAISAIVSTVQSIIGITSVAISSPQYDSTHDEIAVAPSQKTLIINPSVDISVAQIGN